MVARDEDLRADGRGMLGEQRQHGVGRGAGDDFQLALFLKFAERADEIAAIGQPSVARVGEAMVIHPRQRLIGLVPVRAMDFFFREFDQALEVPLVTVLQERVEQHGAKRGRKREREARVHAVAQPAVHGLDQRDVGFGDGFEEPVFLEELLVFGMAHKGQMRVKHEGEVALHAGWVGKWSSPPRASGRPPGHQPTIRPDNLPYVGQHRSFYQNNHTNHKRNGKPDGVQDVGVNLVVLAFDPINNEIQETHDDETAGDEPDEVFGLAGGRIAAGV